MSRGAAPPQGDRKGPRSAPRHPRPYKDDEKDEELLRVIVRAGAVRMSGWDPCGRPGVGERLLHLTPIGRGQVH